MRSNKLKNNTMHIKFKKTEKVKLFVQTMNKLLRITAAFISVDEANCYCESHKDEGVVAEIGETILIANLYDHGIRLKSI